MLKDQAPVALLLDKRLTPAAKVLWLALAAAGPGRLAARTGLTYATIRQAQAQLEAAGLYPPAPATQPPLVSIPEQLLAEPGLRPQAKLLYGLLQTLGQPTFTFASLGAHAGLSPATARQNIQDLARTGWVETSQKSRLTPVGVTLHNPELERLEEAAAQTKERIRTALHRGEVIMREYLSLLIDSTEFKDNARPDWLVNPLSGNLLELDRYYPAGVAFEFNGPQHEITTERFPSEQALAEQRARDLMKESLCARHGVKLVVVTGDDLTLAAMQQKAGQLLPLRDLTGRQKQIAALEKAGRIYRARLRLQA